MQRVISRNSPEKMEVKVGNRLYQVVFSPLPEQERIIISGFDISDQKEFEKEIQKNETREVENIKLEDIFDIPAIQSLIDDLYKLTHITIGLIDLKGNVSVIAGRQEICSRFHRVHPETCKKCIESDTKLSLGVAPAELKMYKCKNNMWDIATPLIVEGQHIGNIISGQFFFDDEHIDYELFRSQARKYGFNEEEYLAALEKVPRLSREAVNKNMSFFMKLANTLSQLSHSNFKLAKSLSERDTLLEALRKSESKYLQIMETAQEGVWIIDCNDRTVFANQRLSKMLGYNIDEIMGQTPQKFLSSEFLTMADDRLREHRQRVRQAIDYRFTRKDGSDLWCIVSTHQLFDDEGNYAGSLGMLTDITERKKAEEALRESEEQYRMLFTNMTEGFGLLEIIYNNDGRPYDYRYLETNPAFELYLGVKKEQMLGRTMREVFPNVSPIAIEKYGEVALSYQPKNFEIFSEIANRPLDIHAFVSEKGKLALILRDITERKVAEAKLKDTLDNLDILVKERTVELEQTYNSLKESERRLAEAQEIANIGSWERNIATNKLHWSDEMYRIFGLKPQEFEMTYDLFLSHYVHPEDQDYLDNAVKGALNGKPFSIDYRIILANGEERIVHAKGEVVFDEQHNPVRIRGTTQDITEHKQTEEAIKKQASLIDLSPDAIITCQLDGTITFWSKGAQLLYGWTSQEAIGRIAQTLLKTRFLQPLEQIIKQVQSTGYWSGELIHFTKDDRQVIVQSRWQAEFDDQGNVKDIFESNVDISERKNSEEALQQSNERLRLAQQAARIGTFEWNIQTGVNTWTPEMEAVYGLQPGEFDKTQTAWEQLVHAEDRQNAINMVEQAFQTGEPTEGEWRIIWRDGSIHWLTGRFQVFRDEAGQPLRLTGVNIDITKQKEADEALAKIEIARKQEIHHRIKNNLQVISSLLDLQAEQFRVKEFIKNSEVLEAFRESQDRVISMALIHEELYKGGGFETLNFSPYIKELTENLYQTYSVGKNNISLKLDLEENTYLDMDIAVPLGIIVNEFVSNSLKHAFPTGNEGEIRIELHREKNEECITNDEDCTTFVLTVSDNGIGIPDDFEIEELDSLGMQLVNTLVDQLDGELEIKRDNGTEFTVRFTVTENNNSTKEASYLRLVDND